MKDQKNKTNSSQTENIETIEDIRKFIREDLENNIRVMALEWGKSLIEKEVQFLCGELFSRKSINGFAHRGGSEPGSIWSLNKKEKILRPRVRKDNKEIYLSSYTELHENKDIGELVFKLMVNGLSTRSFRECLQEVSEELGVSKSKISRKFIQKSREYLNQINTRRFKNKKFWAIIVDGIHISDEVLVVALGVDEDGNKQYLGVFQGSSESSEIVSNCLNSISERNIQFTDKVLAVIDGSKALRKGLVEYFGDRVSIQRCFNHKMRNIEACLPEKYHGDFKTKFKMCYGLNDYKSAKEEFLNLDKWLCTISDNASASLLEGLEDILTLHKIKMPPALRISFYTTNCIDSAFSHPRSQLNRVKRWRMKNDMVRRWAGALFYRQEKHFRKVRNYKMIPEFLEIFSKQIEKNIDEKKEEYDYQKTA